MRTAPTRALSLAIMFALSAGPSHVHADERVKKTVEANQVAEFAFTSSVDYADPFNDVQLDAIVTTADGNETRHPTFWAGGKTWKFRYSATQPGLYRFRTECSDAKNVSLHDALGAVEVTPYSGDNALLKHGPIHVAKDKRHLAYADGTPFFWLGDTWWMMLTDRMSFDDLKTLAADRRQKGFNVVQLVAGVYPDMPAFDPRGKGVNGFPWTDDYSTIRPEFFDDVDRRIGLLVDEGFVPCIVGAWGYHLEWMTEAQLKAHWRYLIARYGALPVVWVAGGEITMPWYRLEKDKRKAMILRQSQVWTDILRYIHEIDGFHRLATVHPSSNERSSRDAVTDRSQPDFELLQMGHGRTLDHIDHLAEHIGRIYSAEPTMPVINGEFAYEGLDLRPRGLFIVTTEMTRKLTWISVLSCGAAGVTYGGNGIWQVNRPGQPFGPSPSGMSWGDTPWQEAMSKPGSTQVAAIKRLLAPLDWYDFRPMHDRVTWYTDMAAETDNTSGPYAMGSDKGTLVVYALAPRPIVVKGLDPKKPYTARYFDPVACQEHDDSPAIEMDEKGVWQCPPLEVDHDWALIVVPEREPR